jgi:hypothetical protein
MTKVLSHQELSHLAREGWLKGIPILSPEGAKHYRSCLEALERKHPEHVKKLKSKSHVLCPWVVELARTTKVLDLYADFCGSNFMLRNMAWRVKKNDGVTFAGWHQDNVYGGNTVPSTPVGVLALSDCNSLAGCLRVIPRSHKWGLMPHQDFDDPTSILARGQQISAEFDKSEAVDLDLKPGEMALFNPACVHGSAPNRSDDRRIFVLMEYVPTFAVTEDGVKDSAMLVRGVDEYDHFNHEREPDAEFSEAAQAEWSRVIQHRARQIFGQSKLAVSEAYGGTRQAVYGLP